MSVLSKKVIHALDGAGSDTGPYLVRWSLTTPFGDIKLHHILRSDEERDLHDHPWSFVSLILWGGYWEHTAEFVFGDPRYDYRDSVSGLPSTRRTWHGPGSILRRPAPSPHRLELPRGRSAWTLVITGPRTREWGFRTICGWLPWNEYARGKQEGC